MKIQCPDQCNGGASERQIETSPELISKFPEEVQKKIRSSGKGYRCTYCGRVYLEKDTERLGFWNSGTRGPGWH